MKQMIIFLSYLSVCVFSVCSSGSSMWRSCFQSPTLFTRLWIIWCSMWQTKTKPSLRCLRSAGPSVWYKVQRSTPLPFRSVREGNVRLFVLFYVFCFILTRQSILNITSAGVFRSALTTLYLHFLPCCMKTTQIVSLIVKKWKEHFPLKWPHNIRPMSVCS